MLEFTTWRDLVVAYVRARVPRLGWRFDRVRRARSSRSWYIVLRCGAVIAEVRVSDHRPARAAAVRKRLFSVRQAASARLEDLDAFLSRRLEDAEGMRPFVSDPSGGTG